MNRDLCGNKYIHLRMNQVNGILKSFHIKDFIQEDWLQDCIEYCQETGDLATEFRKQILFSDLNDYAAECKHIQDQVSFTFFQIMDIEEIGLSKMAVLESLTEKEVKNVPRCMLKYSLMSAGKQIIDMIELNPVQDLNLLTPLGTKLIVKHGVVKRGVLIVKGQDVNVLGGEVDDLNDIEPKIRIINRYRDSLGMEAEANRGPATSPALAQQVPIGNNLLEPPPERIPPRQPAVRDIQQQKPDIKIQKRNLEISENAVPQQSIPSATNVSTNRTNASGSVDVSKLRELFSFQEQVAPVQVKNEIPEFEECDDFDDFAIENLDLPLKIAIPAVYNQNDEYPIEEFDDGNIDTLINNERPAILEEYNDEDEYPIDDLDYDLAEFPVKTENSSILGEYNGKLPLDDLESRHYKLAPGSEASENDEALIESEGEEFQYIPDSPDLAADSDESEKDENVKIQLTGLDRPQNQVLQISSSFSPPPVPATKDFDLKVAVAAPSKKRRRTLDISSSTTSPKKAGKISKVAIDISSSPDLTTDKSEGDLILSRVIKCKDFRAINTKKSANTYSIRCKVFSYGKLGKDYLQNVCLLDCLGNTLDAVIDPICVKNLFSEMSFEDLQSLKSSNVHEAKKMARSYFNKLENYDGDMTIDVFEKSVRVIAM